MLNDEKHSRVLSSPQFWSIVVIYVLITLHHYNDQTSYALIAFPDASLGITRHTIDRILYLIPIILSSIMYGPRGGATALIMAVIAMLPRAILISNSPVTALLETSGVAIIGSFAPLWSRHIEKQAKQLALAVEELQTTQQQLLSEVQLSAEQKKQLSVINSFSTILSQSLDLDRVLQTASSMVRNVMQVEAVLIFTLERNSRSLRINAFDGIREKSAMALDGMNLGEGLCGRVAKTGQPILVENTSDESELCSSAVLDEGLESLLSVPLLTRGKIVGTLCVGTRVQRQFEKAEVELLSALGNLIGIAVDNSYLYHEREDATDQLKSSEEKYRNLFENAHVGIWVQDLSGKITDANLAAAILFGCNLSELIGSNISQFLPKESIMAPEMAGRNPINGHDGHRPYVQTIIKKDGSEAIVRVNTNPISSNGHPEGFQFIGREITNEVRMQENQTFYLQQVTQAHEEERLRISRDLHDSTAQSLIAILHQLEVYHQADKDLPEVKSKFLLNIHDQLKCVLKDIRRLSRDLRPSIIDDLGILPAVEWLVEQFKAENNIEAVLKMTGEEKRFSREIEVTLFRIVQEALRNIARHSRATQAEISLSLNETATKIVISDNGKGFVVPASLGDFSRIGKLGIDGMATRARLVDGTFEIKSELGTGTAVIVSIPA